MSEPMPVTETTNEARFADQRARLARAARELAAAGLLVGTAGNVSLRDGDLVQVTASGVVLEQCVAADIVTVTLDGQVVAGHLVPTSELDLHLAAYESTDAAAVVHTHGPLATTIACAADRFPAMPVLHYQQILLGGEIRIAPYATFGTPELASSVMEALAGRQAALMANHGSVTIGPTLEKAVENAILLEWLCGLLHRVSLTVETPSPLTHDQQVAVIEQALLLKYGTTQEQNP